MAEQVPSAPHVMRLDSKHFPIRLFLFCLSAELALLLLDLSINFYQYSDSAAIRRLFNMAREDSLANWFMVIQTFVAAMLLLAIALVENDRATSTRQYTCWLLLAIFFIYLSADDAAQIHERLGTAFDARRPELGFVSLFPGYGWQLAVLPLLVLAGLLMVWFLWNELAMPYARILLLMAPGIMALAVGLDFIEGLEHEHPWNFYTWLSERWQVSPKTIRHFAKVIEEFLEMLSISLLLMLFAQRLLQAVSPQWTINVGVNDNQ